MPLVTLRPKGQLTIPVNILQQWNIKPYEQLEVSFQNGIVTMMPAKRKEQSRKSNLKAFAGIGQGCWGDTPEAVQDSIHNLRNSWTR
ncbi:MAG: AbrB/MazE/SpoVT family DNA-binding domain-containing protein [bacterium]